ncbi:PREDICTED: major facilitator superfamily domain-containing protein 12-like [Acropora digitifera]|uniref:major facilitator superfamily domain-containing protein 12-like n=1 Tax=Acropora digitifera TaxID=70779 RepID=UPI00077B20E2|nr:PREDICTED: major facilitator superfamily domain-containing protein 12-like [Acropora digitifera]
MQRGRRNCFCAVEKNSENKTDKLSMGQKFCFGVGHILNDLAVNAWFSYFIIYLIKVAQLSKSQTGLVVMFGQVTEGISSLVTAILIDKTVCRYGRRKIWHLVGSVCVCLTLPLLFTRLLGNEASDTLKLVYYIGVTAVFQFSWGCVQISHLSLIPEIASRETEKVELNAIRSALRFVCGIFVFGVTWILLRKSSEDSISPATWKQFMYLALIIVGTGIVFNVIFHVGIKEPPSDALKGWLDELKNGKQRRNKSNRIGKELEVVSQPSAATKASGISESVVMALGEKKGNSENNSESGTIIEKSESSINSVRTISSSQKREIINRSAAVPGKGKTRTQWLRCPGLYKMGIVYICARLYVNVSQSYLPLYLTETMRFEMESIAYFPLTVLVTGALASIAVKPMNKNLGSKITFCVGALIAIGASVWFFAQNVDTRSAVYATSILMGSGGSIMLVTSFSFIATLIGDDKNSGAFVYGVIGFFDKVFTGAIFKIIQDLDPQDGQRNECRTCDDHVRRVQSLVPGVAAVVGLLCVLVFFESNFVCKKQKATTVDVEIQVDFNENKEGYHNCDASSSGRETASIIEKPSVEDMDLGISENRATDRTCNRSI